MSEWTKYPMFQKPSLPPPSGTNVMGNATVYIQSWTRKEPTEWVMAWLHPQFPLMVHS